MSSFNPISDAEIARSRAWGKYDILEGRDGDTVSRIRILFVGKTIVVAEEIMRNGKRYEGDECAWSLRCREWERVFCTRCDGDGFDLEHNGACGECCINETK